MKKYSKMLSLLLILVVPAMIAGCGQSAPTAQPEKKMSRIDEIKKNGKLVLATGNYRPFEYHDEKTNKIIGYDIDVAEAIAKKNGVPFEIKEM